MDARLDDSSVSDNISVPCIIIYHQLSVCDPLQLKYVPYSVGQTAPENGGDAVHCVKFKKKAFILNSEMLILPLSTSHSIDMGSFEDPTGNNKPVTYKQPDWGGFALQMGKC